MARKNTTTVTAPVAVEAEVKRGPGRPRIHLTPEAVAEAKRNAVKRYNVNKTKRNLEVAAAILALTEGTHISKEKKAEVKELVASLKF